MCQKRPCGGTLLFAAILLGLYVSPPPSRQAPIGRPECWSVEPSFAAKVEVSDRVPTADIVVYGATGFTGTIVARWLALRPGNLSYAIGGRSKWKLERLAEQLSPRAPLEVLVAESSDLEALRGMVRRARVVLSIVGPYRQYGSLLALACAEEGVHYADLSGEPTWQRSIVAAHHDRAALTGAKLVVAAGFDSMPFDIGAQLALEALDKKLTRKVADVSIQVLITHVRAWLSGGTMKSGLMEYREAFGTSQWSDPYLLVPFPRCRVDTDVIGWGLLRFDQVMGRWGIPSEMARINGRVVRRTLELLGRHGVSYGEGFSLASLIDAALWLVPYFWRGEVRLMMNPGEGPSLAMQLTGEYKMSFVARDHRTGIHAQIDAEGFDDPAYLHTAKLVVELGACLAEDECHRFNSGGGVFTPASAANTSKLVAMLQAAKAARGAPLLTYREVFGQGRRGLL